MEFCYARGRTEGLPVVPPTEDRVLRMLAGTARRANETVAWIPPRRGPLVTASSKAMVGAAGCCTTVR